MDPEEDQVQGGVPKAPEEVQAQEEVELVKEVLLEEDVAPSGEELEDLGVPVDGVEGEVPVEERRQEDLRLVREDEEVRPGVDDVEFEIDRGGRVEE